MATQRLLGSYYFRAGAFTLVPHHICAELDEMHALGTDIVCLAVNSHDCHKNLEFLVQQIHQRGMQVYVVPSRTAGITAGAPLTADAFGYRHPHTWTLNRDGTPLIRNNGVVCSFYHPEVEEHMLTEVTQMIQRFGIDGIIWDEPKSTNWQDLSAKALEHNPTGNLVTYLDDFTAFFSRINAQLKARFPKVQLLHFDEACRSDAVVAATAKIEHLDYVGVDGQPWHSGEFGPSENRREQKVLPYYGERYLTAARQQGKGTFALIENQGISGEQLDWFERDINDVLSIDADLILYYYYGIYTADIERNMDIVRKHLPPWRKQRK